MRADEIRNTFLSFFEARGHKLMPSASLVPSTDDPSVLLTTAGMQPFKPWFLGHGEPPAPRLCSVQRCFRTTDIDQVGNTARHLTCFEMLGNWSFGDFFKQESIAWGWELSIEGFGLDPERIWVTVFAGDPELGLELDTEAVEIWKRLGVPEERIVALPRAENFWQAGPTGPCGPSSELYLDRGEGFGAPGDRPGDDTDRFLEYWNHVFMCYELHADGSVSDLPMKNIDTGMGLERMAAILQDVPSVFETDVLRPLVDLAEELSGRSYGDDPATTRAMRIIADHSRGTALLIADGVVPSNEDRGYVLRRIMRRAIQQGRVLELEAPYLGRFAERAIELLGSTYPVLSAEREAVMRWVGDEEESFGRTLDRGSQMLGELIDEAQLSAAPSISSEDAFKLHDTYGFPFELTRELLAEESLTVDERGFDRLMSEQRERARASAAGAQAADRDQGALGELAGSTPPSRFVGYEKLSVDTSLTALRIENGGALVKLAESPFYPEGGGQVSDSGVLRWDGGEARVAGVHRVGDDQVIRIPRGIPSASSASPAGVPGGAGGAADGVAGLEPGTRVVAEVERATRHATMCNHTATHLLHAALRERLGTHVHQAGSAVRPDKLRFDFTHGASLGAADLEAVDARVNEWIKGGAPVRAMQMGRDEAERLGAMALFGEKYGEWVRVVEVDGVSRELCGGTHVANTAEIGIFKITSEGSSAANVRRIEALTGPAAIDWYRERDQVLEQVAAALGGADPVAAANRAAERLAELERERRKAGTADIGRKAEEMVGSGTKIDGVTVVAETAEGADQRELLKLADRVRSMAGEAAVVLGGIDGDKVSLVAAFSPGAIERGLSAVSVVRDAAAIVGGGGGGRDDMAQAGGRDPTKLGEALALARRTIESTLGAN